MTLFLYRLYRMVGSFDLTLNVKIGLDDDNNKGLSESVVI